MKCSAMIAALTAAMWIGSDPASAEILQLTARIQGGGGSGRGVSGAQMDNSFHEGATGAIYGAAVGVEFLMIDGWIEHNQYTGSDGLIGTWTQFMAGVDLNMDIGEKKGGGEYNPNGNLAKGSSGYSSMYAEFGMGVGFGVGTGQQVDPPLDNSELTDKGFLVQAHFGLGYRLTKMLSIGVSIPVQGGYMFKTGDGLVANDVGTHYRSVQAAALVNLRMDVTLK